MPSIPGNLSPEDARYVEEILEHKPFDEINETQQRFLESGGLDPDNTLLVAETGNGKTFCAESRVKKALENGQTVAYLVPSKQLTTGKYGSLTEWIDTDQFDVRNASWRGPSGYTEADVIIATFESYFEAVLRGVDYRLDLLVLDDFHELYSEYRGPSIEKGITAALDRGAEIMAMSATIGNPAEIAQWLDSSLIISPEDRGVPIKEIPIKNDDRNKGELIADVIRDNNDIGPFIVFNFQKSWTESRAREIAKACSFDGPTIEYREELTERIDTALTNKEKTLLDLMEQGVAFHHADLRQATKNLVEEAVKDGDIKCLTATTTLAYGFDAPIQSVIVADLTRGWGYRKEFVGRWEYIQWIGRAGRDASRYDQAYAFPIFGVEDTHEYFEFGTPVEEKSIEAIASHLGVASDERAQEDLKLSNPMEAKRNRRWLILELICGGWQREEDLLKFLYHSLFWQQMVGGSRSESFEIDAAKEKLQDTLYDTIKWLAKEGLIDLHTERSYSPTKTGEACFEYNHSTWVNSSLADLKSIIDWIDRQDTITPEGIIETLAETYPRDCDLGVLSDSEDFRQVLGQHKLDSEDEAAQTAGIVCWYWCQGIPVNTIEVSLGNVDISHLPTTVQRNIVPAVDAMDILFEATDTQPPEWLDTFVDVLDAGVTVDDLYLTSLQGIARGRVTSLESRTNSGLDGLNTDIALAAPLIVKLAARWQEHAERDTYRTTLTSADHIGMETAEKIMDAVEEWIKEAPDDGRKEVLFQTSARQFLTSWRSGGDVEEFDRSDVEILDEPTTETATLDDFT